ncbi:MAG: RtcB family protein [Anaerolineae bacterium]|nr:RtcB family protein [Anaerolineae bacterium]
MSTPHDLSQQAPFRVWGRDQIDTPTLRQLELAVRLPISLRGALMPDAHVGYGLPIGGVLATDNAVIPYAVGVDIACRVRMTIFNTSPFVIEQKREKLRRVIEDNTCFGQGAAWDRPQQHEVMDDPEWDTHPFARQKKDLAWKQLGSSGAGNHFVEFGELVVQEQFGRVPPGNYLALLSHSGSRRFGFDTANHYTQVAKSLHADRLPKEYLNLAWLELGQDGDEYWRVMQLAGRYASANHAVIHRLIAAALRYDVLDSVENHHNFAWQEVVDGRTAIVHRKGATPAGSEALGVIPGSMSAPGYIVRGLGNAEAMNSAAHGAGRQMSRAEAKRVFEWGQVNRRLKEQRVELISAGLDEVPGAYKDIHRVMAAQADLVAAVAEFRPRLVKMAPDERGRRQGKPQGKRKDKGRRSRR